MSSFPDFTGWEERVMIGGRDGRSGCQRGFGAISSLFLRWVGAELRALQDANVEDRRGWDSARVSLIREHRVLSFS